MTKASQVAWVAAGLLGLTGCSVLGLGSSPSDLARTTGHANQSYEGMPAVSPTRHADIGSMIICADSRLPVRIDSATAIDPVGKITVVDIRTRPNPFVRGEDGIGSAFGALRSLGIASDRTILPCKGSDAGAGSEVVLELSIPTGTNAAARGWTFRVTDGQRTSTMAFPLGVVLCSTASMDAPACNALSTSYGVAG